VEELETTNEELQSTNEELQTMNEELQSSNEELHTINVDLQEHGDVLLEKNAFLESLMRSLRMGVAIVNRDLEVTGWNTQAESLWGLRSDEALGHSLLALDIGLPIADIEDRIRKCLDGTMEHEIATLEGTNRRGKRIVCRVSCTPLLSQDGRATGVILTMEEEPGP
jgi:two-component system CheB/CheR fusion protein